MTNSSSTYRHQRRGPMSTRSSTTNPAPHTIRLEIAVMPGLGEEPAAGSRRLVRPVPATVGYRSGSDPNAEDVRTETSPFRHLLGLPRSYDRGAELPDRYSQIDDDYRSCHGTDASLRENRIAAAISSGRATVSLALMSIEIGKRSASGKPPRDMAVST